MAYLQHTSWRERPGPVIGVVAIHAVIGYALVTGLTFDKIIQNAPPLEGYEVKVPLDPPPPPPEPAVEPEAQAISPPMHVPTPPLDISPQRPAVDSTPEILPTPDFIPKILPSATPAVTVTPRPTFSPISARPRGDPGSWVTEADYRSSWINREMTGTARFRLAIGGTGKVEGCTITASSGHPELDKATCELVTRRARFEPAKDDTGAPAAGSYASSVRWVLPE